jgi:CheY-like chemotaxis protein
MMQKILIATHRKWNDLVCQGLNQLFDDLVFFKAEHGLNALTELTTAIIDKDPYDLIVLDNDLPLINGLACVENFRAIEYGLLTRPTPILLCSHQEGDEGFLAAHPQTLHLHLPNHADDPYLIEAAILQILARIDQMHGAQS